MLTFCSFLSGLFFAASVLLTTQAGIMDYTGETRVGKISKEHIWNDGLYLLLLAIFLIQFC
jgi:hypothetical protein